MVDESKMEEPNDEIREKYLKKIFELFKNMSIDKLRYYYTYIVEYEKE